MHKIERLSMGRNKAEKIMENLCPRAHPGNRTPVSTVGGYYDTTTLDALIESGGYPLYNIKFEQYTTLLIKFLIYRLSSVTLWTPAIHSPIQ